MSPVIFKSDGLVVGDSLTLNLFSDAVYTAYVDKVTSNVNGTTTVRGRIENDPLGYTIITTTGNRSLVEIEIPEENQHFIIQSDPLGNHYLIDSNNTVSQALEGAPSLIPPVEAVMPGAQKDNVALGNPLDAVTIDVMIVYTPAAHVWGDISGGGIDNVIAQAMAKGQLACDNSNIILTLRLVRSSEIAYTESGSSYTDLGRLQNTTDGYMDTVHTWRAQSGADVVTLLAQVEDVGGLGYLLNTTAGSPSYAFNLCRVQQAGWTYTVVHEQGHNLGCHHSKLQNTQPGPGLFSYSAGWRWVGTDGGSYCSVMTYESGTYFADGYSHIRVGYWSNPSITYQGVVTGNATDGDNARSIREIKQVVAAYCSADTTLPTITINQASGQADPTGASPINFTVVFSEPVLDFVTGDVTITGTAGGSKTTTVTGSGTTYNVAVSGMTSGTVIANLAAGVAHDAAGNASVASTSTDNVVTYDNTVPTVTINQAAGQADLTNGSPINFTVVFSETVTDLATGDVTITGTAGGSKTTTVTGSGTTYNVAVSGMTSGTVIADLAAGVANDAAGNASVASTSVDSMVVYGTSVTVNQAPDQIDPTSSSPIKFTVVFSSPVTDFAAGDVTLSGTAGATIASVSNPSGDNMTYTVAVSGMRRTGTVIAAIYAGVAHNAGGVGNDASTSVDNMVVYGTSVTVNQAADQIDPSSSSPIKFTVVFSAPVMDFTDGDVTISGTAGGTKTANVTGSGTTYTVEVNGMTTSGTVWVSISPGVAHNATGSPNVASTSTDNRVTYDIGGLIVDARGDWWMFGHDPQRTNRSLFVGPSVPTQKWTFAGVGGWESSPAIGSDGTIYVGSWDGNLYAINPNGSNKWQFATEGWETSSPAIGSDGTIYVESNVYDYVSASYVGYLYAINPDGSKKWQFETGNWINSSPAIGSDGTIYVGSYAGNVYAINPEGTKKWEFAIEGWGTSSPAIGFDGTIYVRSNEYDELTGLIGSLYAINLDGSKKWQFETGGAMYCSSPAIGSDGTIYIGSYKYDDVSEASVGNLYAINPDGSYKWEFAGVGGSSSSPTIGSDGTIYVGSDVGNFYAINPDGSKKWESATGYGVYSSPAIGSDGTIYVRSNEYDDVSESYDGNFCAINPAGSQKWNFATGSYLDSPPAIGGDGTIYVGSGGRLYAIGSRPSVRINQATGQADPTSASLLMFTAEFTEPVFGVTDGDVTLRGTAGATTANISNPSGDYMTYTVKVSGMQFDGTVTVTIPAGVARSVSDCANDASTSTDNTVTYGNPRPAVAVNQAVDQADITGSSPVWFTIAFSEPVTGFSGGDVTLGGTAGAAIAGVSNPSGDNTTYAVAVSGMTMSGTVWVSVPGSVVYNAAGIPNIASTSTDNTVTYYIGGLPISGGDWWMFRHDRQHTGRSPFEGPITPTKKWEFATGGEVMSSPAIGSDATLYVGSNEYDYVSGSFAGNLYAINADGSKKWKIASGRYVYSSPAIGFDGTIYVGSYEYDEVSGSSVGNLYAINPDGSYKWEFAMGGDVTSSPAIGSDGTVYVGSWDNNLYAINPDGSQKWVFATGASVSSSPAIGSDGTVYVGSWDNNLYAINPDGSYKWEFAGVGGSSSDLAIGSDGTIYVGSDDGNFYAINPDGSKKWVFFATGAYVYFSPAIGSDGTIYVGSGDGTFYAINPDGSKKWEFITGGSVYYSSPAIGGDGTIYVESEVGNLYAINPDGSQKWEFATGGWMSSPAIGSDGTLYSMEYDESTGYYSSNLYAIGPGAQRPSVSINQAASQTDPTNSCTINFTVAFSELVTDFATGDVAISGTAGGIKTATVTGSGTIYNVAVSGMTSDGTVIVDVAAGVAHDSDEGNANTASISTDNTVTFHVPVLRKITSALVLLNWTRRSDTTLPFSIQYRKSGSVDAPTVVNMDLLVKPSSEWGMVTFTLSGLPPDIYDISVKCSHWLTTKLTGINVTVGDSTDNTMALRNGDINSDNSVNFSDYLILQTQYKKPPGNPSADLNGDGAVNFSDYLILQANYKKVGDTL